MNLRKQKRAYWCVRCYLSVYESLQVLDSLLRWKVSFRSTLLKISFRMVISASDCKCIYGLNVWPLKGLSHIHFWGTMRLNGPSELKTSTYERQINQILYGVGCVTLCYDAYEGRNTGCAAGSFWWPVPTGHLYRGVSTVALKIYLSQYELIMCSLLSHSSIL